MGQIGQIVWESRHLSKGQASCPGEISMVPSLASVSAWQRDMGSQFTHFA